jgi:dephospho-CoA kinase
MLVLGLTGSVGMGKSNAAMVFADLGAAVFDADRTVHALYGGSAARLVEAAFPGSTRDGAVDRLALAEQTLGVPDALDRLEAIIHPLVLQAEDRLRARAVADGRRLLVLDIPLLFETGATARVDAVAVVTASTETQRARVLARPGMTEERLEAILARQLPDADKRRRSHFLINTEGDLAATRRQIADIVRAVAGTAAGR